MVDEISHATGSIGIIVYQIPNCPMVYPADPIQKHRSEDDMIGFAWLEFLRLLSSPYFFNLVTPRLPQPYTIAAFSRLGEGRLLCSH